MCDATITVQTKNRVKPLGDLFGIFFEDLNHAADGGLYAEMVQNRSFAFSPADHPDYHAMTAWDVVQRGKSLCACHVESHTRRHPNNPNYLVLEVLQEGPGAGIRNSGYNTGIPLQQGAIYCFSMYARRLTAGESPVYIRLESMEGTVYSEVPLTIDSHGWKQYGAQFISTATDFSGRLTVIAREKLSLAIDMVSLFPKDTFLGQENGLRKDIAQMLADMKPKFLRFPGGCLVHDGSLDEKDRTSLYRWKNTLGRPEDRPPKRNSWGYNQTLGLGYYEYFCFAEAIGAKPLPVLPAGYDPHHKRIVPLDELEPWIADALDLIEFANGSPESKWGAKRAEMGHPEPFGLEYLAIGNEEVGEPFFERYAVFHRRIKARYPDIRLINSASPFAAGSEYDRGWKSARDSGSELIDEHYYCSPEWFLANMHRYDQLDANGPGVFLGEYASWGNQWGNALVEAAYMIGLEKAPAVALACYAPLLCNADYINWKPDMIWFDNHRVYGTANYYVQKLFMKHQGDMLLQTDMEGFAEPVTIPADLTGGLEICTTYARVAYSEISINHNGQDRTVGDYEAVEGKTSYRICETSGDFTLRFTACKSEFCNAVSECGGQGVEIRFAIKDADNYMSFILGGWQNQDCFIRSVINGRGSDLTQSLFSMEPSTVYSCELSVMENRVFCKVNHEVLVETICKPQILEPLYVSSGIEEASGDIIVKAVNVREHTVSAMLRLSGSGHGMHKVDIHQMRYALHEENSFEEPERVKPVYSEEWVTGETDERRFPPHSLTVLRYQKTEL